MNPITQLNGLLLSDKLLSRPNAERVARVCYDAAKIVYERQKKLKKRQLKIKEVSAALALAESMHSGAFHFDATGEMASLFGECPQGRALDYYENSVMGTVRDVHGREIEIDLDGMKSLYKEAGTGKHIVDAENYEQVRGKRLPWIRHVLQRSEAIYVVEETVQRAFRRSYLYTAIVSIPLQPKAQTQYYVVVVRESKNGDLRFLTAYSMDKRNRFLGVISLCSMYKCRYFNDMQSRASFRLLRSSTT